MSEEVEALQEFDRWVAYWAGRRWRAQSTVEALFGMARRAAYWRWAYRGAQRSRAQTDLAFRLIKENWLFAEADALRLRAALNEIASRGCESGFGDCSRAYSRQEDWCHPCIAGQAIGVQP